MPRSCIRSQNFSQRDKRQYESERKRIYRAKGTARLAEECEQFLFDIFCMSDQGFPYVPLRENNPFHAILFAASLDFGLHLGSEPQKIVPDPEVYWSGGRLEETLFQLDFYMEPAKIYCRFYAPFWMGWIQLYATKFSQQVRQIDISCNAKGHPFLYSISDFLTKDIPKKKKIHLLDEWGDEYYFELSLQHEYKWRDDENWADEPSGCSEQLLEQLDETRFANTPPGLFRLLQHCTQTGHCEIRKGLKGESRRLSISKSQFQHYSSV